MGRRLTLISASAGFGKTTLVRQWLAQCRRPVAWLSLDEGDGEPARFLTYLIASLQTIVPSIGKGVLEVLQTPHPPSTESVLTVLLNEIAAIPDPFILVLDDYHVIDAKPVDDALAFLLEHLPPQMHLVIATREDPSLPLARLRARGQLTESLPLLDLLRLPELFPFRFTVGPDVLRRSPYFAVERQGGGWDAVRMAEQGGKAK